MSLETWRDEFYPITAHDIARQYERDDETTVADLVDHCLRKWRGLREENLAKHGIKRVAAYYISGREDGPGILDDSFMIAGSTCALCVAFDPQETYDEETEECVTNCGDCPLYLSRGNVSCDKAKTGERLSPYGAFTMNDDPEPMIAALEKCL